MTVQGLEYSDPLHYASFGSDTTDDGGMNLDIVPLKCSGVPQQRFKLDRQMLCARLNLGPVGVMIKNSRCMQVPLQDIMPCT